MASKVVFYCRVSTKDQRLDLQVHAARRRGVAEANIYVEKASGVRRGEEIVRLFFTGRICRP